MSTIMNDYLSFYARVPLYKTSGEKCKTIVVVQETVA